MRDTGIAARLRAAGITVVEVAGWQTRGVETGFNPRGSVNHHTAGPKTGATPSLNTVIYGRPDLPGPLCHVLQSRERDGNDKAYVIAAGRANHGGPGGWKGLEGNSSVFGLEIEHTGTDPLPIERQLVAARIHAALLGDGKAGMVCQHREWARPPGRKIDCATNVDPDGFRAMVATAKPPAPTPTPTPPPKDDEMRPYIITPRKGDPDGTYNPRLVDAPFVVSLTSDDVAAHKAAGVPVIVTSKKAAVQITEQSGQALGE